MNSDKKYISVNLINEPQTVNEPKQVPNSTQEAINLELKELYQQFEQSMKKLDQKRDNQNYRLERVKLNSQYQLKQDIKDQMPIDGDYVQGSKIYMQYCSSCHSLEMNSLKKNNQGPALGSIMGKMAAGDMYISQYLSHYKNYSDELINSKIFWCSNSLFQFIQNPQDLVPGTKCKIKSQGIQSDELRSDLICFFKLFGKRLTQNLKVHQIRNFGKEYADSQELTQTELIKLQSEKIQQ